MTIKRRCRGHEKSSATNGSSEGNWIIAGVLPTVIFLVLSLDTAKQFWTRLPDLFQTREHTSFMYATF